MDDIPSASSAAAASPAGSSDGSSASLRSRVVDDWSDLKAALKQSTESSPGFQAHDAAITLRLKELGFRRHATTRINNDCLLAALWFFVRRTDLIVHECLGSFRSFCTELKTSLKVSRDSTLNLIGEEGERILEFLRRYLLARCGVRVNLHVRLLIAEMDLTIAEIADPVQDQHDLDAVDIHACVIYVHYNHFEAVTEHRSAH